MNIVKVYNADGVHVDSFRKLQSKRAIYNNRKLGTRTRFGELVRYLNSKQYFIRRQLTNTRAALGNVGLFSTSKIGASLRSMFK